MAKQQAMSPEVVKLLATPVGFAGAILGMHNIYQWQSDALTAVCRNNGRNRTAVCAPNGSGKSERVVAAAVLWWLAVHPRGKVIVTTADGKQLDGQIIPAIWKHRGTFPAWRFVEREITTPTGGFAKFWTTDEPGRAEGWHGKTGVDEPLLVIVDEAKSVPEKIFEALDRCTFQSILYISSPGLMEGRFYDAFTKHLDRYYIKQVGLKDCPHISAEKIQDIIKQYGSEDHPFVQSCLHGRFMDNTSDSYVFNLSDYNAMLKAVNEGNLKFNRGRRVAFVDFGGGMDETVIALRDGNKIEILKAWRQPNEMLGCAEIVQCLRRNGLEPQDTFGDVCGMGKVMISRMEELGWPMNRVNSGIAASKRDYYKNAGTEMWAETSLALKRQEVILPEDETLKTQLTTRKIVFDAKGRVWMESKDDMRDRGIKSPDRADAVCGAFWCGGIGRSVLLSGGTLKEINIFGDNNSSIDAEWEPLHGPVVAGSYAGL